MFQTLLGEIRRRRYSQLLPEAPKRLTLPNTCRVGNVRYANVISQMGLDEPAHFSYPSGGGPRTPSVRLLTGKCEHIEHKMRECKTSVYLKALSARLKSPHGILYACTSMHARWSIGGQKHNRMGFVSHYWGKVLTVYRQRLSTSYQTGIKGHRANPTRRLTLTGMEHVAINKDATAPLDYKGATGSKEPHGAVAHHNGLKLLVPMPRNVTPGLLIQQLVVAFGRKIGRDRLNVLMVIAAKVERASRINHSRSRCPKHDTIGRIYCTRMSVSQLSCDKHPRIGQRLALHDQRTSRHHLSGIC
jgi:hypothetical protein